jgi:hypothetical protein
MRHRPEDREPEVPNGERAFQTIDFASTLAAITSSAWSASSWLRIVHVSSTGYWFELIDPWPADWSYSDDCYIDYIDEEYFLIDPVHPGIRIAVIVVE